MTYSFLYSGLQEETPGAFDALGLAGAETLGFALTLDRNAIPRVVTDLSTTDPAFSASIFRAAYDYLDLQISIDGRSFSGPAAPQQNSFFVQDGEDGTRNTFDDVDLITTTEVGGLNGTLIEFASFSLNNFDETGLAGIAIPTLRELQAVRAGGLFGARLEFSKSGQDYSVSSIWSQGGGLTISQISLTPVPVPGAATLLLLGLGLLALNPRSGAQRRR